MWIRFAGKLADGSLTGETPAKRSGQLDSDFRGEWLLPGLRGGSGCSSESDCSSSASWGLFARVGVSLLLWAGADWDLSL